MFVPRLRADNERSTAPAYVLVRMRVCETAFKVSKSSEAALLGTYLIQKV